jgi:DNA-binding NarL/FixJ family response regulator
MEPDSDRRDGENAKTANGSPAELSPVPGRGERIRILLADDHQILREGLASLLSEEPDMEIVGEAGDGHEAIELARLTRPDVVLMDVTMPRLDGIQATRQITAEMSGVAVIGLSMHEEEDMALAMRSAGAVAYLSKGGPSEALIAAIRSTAG